MDKKNQPTHYCHGEAKEFPVSEFGLTDDDAWVHERGQWHYDNGSPYFPQPEQPKPHAIPVKVKPQH